MELKDKQQQSPREARVGDRVKPVARPKEKIQQQQSGDTAIILGALRESLTLTSLLCLKNIIFVTLQRRGRWLRSPPSPQIWRPGSKIMPKTWRSGWQTVAGLLRWSTIFVRICWNSLTMNLYSSQQSSSTPAATLRKLRWDHSFWILIQTWLF